MKKEPRAKKAKAGKAAIKDLSPQSTDQVKAGKLNLRSVNPIVVARDRSLNS